MSAKDDLIDPEVDNAFVQQ